MIVTFKKIILDNPHDSRRARFPPKMIKIQIERGETLKERNQCRLGERSLGFRLGWWSDRCWSVKGAETASRRTARKGYEEDGAERRVQEVRTQTPRSGFTDPRWKVRGDQAPECGVRFHARISSSTVGPRKSPKNVEVSRVVDRPVTIKARVIE
jgi:hypothetical protein